MKKNVITYLLGLIDSNIQINITNEFSSPREYFPKKYKEKCLVDKRMVAS